MTAQLGLGLIGIGRPWPADSCAVASADSTRILLEAARLSGIKFFDTAPAYGDSENRLGGHLRDGALAGATDLVVATKCGEYWSSAKGAWADHSLAAVVGSVRGSHDRLGRIDLLQVHKASVRVLTDRSLLRLLTQLADDFVIPHLGVSVKDIPSFDAALDAGVFDHIQCPVNSTVPELSDHVGAHSQEVTIVANRPYGSGTLLQSGLSPETLLKYVTDRIGDGIVLTGTTNPEHLRQTRAAFAAGADS